MRLRIQPVDTVDSLGLGWVAGSPLHGGQHQATECSHSYERQQEEKQICDSESIELEDNGNGLHSFSFVVHTTHADECAARLYDLTVQAAHPWHGTAHIYVDRPDGSGLSAYLRSTAPCALRLQNITVRGIATSAEYELRYGELEQLADVELLGAITTEAGPAIATENGEPLIPES